MTSLVHLKLAIITAGVLPHLIQNKVLFLAQECLILDSILKNGKNPDFIPSASEHQKPIYLYLRTR